MATDFCKYHPLMAATFHCASCQIDLCDDCVQPALETDAMPVCFLCNQPVVSLHQAAPVVPFWLQYTQFMRLPLNLLGIFLLVLLFIMPQLLSSRILLPIIFSAYVIAALYGWSLLQQAATGELKDISIEFLSKHTNKLALQTALFIAVVFVALTLLLAKMPLLAGTLGFIFLTMLPAMLIAVAKDQHITSVVQLSGIKEIIESLRFFYAPLVAVSLVLLLMSSAISGLLADVLSASLAQGLQLSLYSYGLWVMMSVVGYVLFEFHQVLNVEVLNKKRKKRTVAKGQDQQQARLAVYLKEGAYEKAAALLKTQTEKQKNNPDIQQKYYQLLVFMQDVEQAPIQASHYIEALLEVEQVAQALEVLVKIRHLVADFVPPSPEIRFNLAKVCVETQHYELAKDLLSQLHKEYPHYQQLPEAYLLLAKILHEKLNKTADALAAMEYLISRFQQHPRYALIDKVWRALGGKPKEDFLV